MVEAVSQISQARTGRSVAIVGCGALTEMYYAPSLREVERAGLATVTAIYDPSPERLSKVGSLLPGAARKSDFKEVLDAAPDLAIVASPAKFHAEQTIALLGRGCFVLCEKPMASNVAEAEEMLRAQGSQSQLAVGLFRRFFPAAQLIRDYVAAETLGKPLQFNFTEGGVFNWPAQSASFFQKKTAQGGVFLDLGVHLLDLVLWWFGEPDEVDYQDDAMGGLEINSILRLGFASGLKGTAQLSRDWDLPNRYEIQFEKGSLAWKVGEANQIEIAAHNQSQAVYGKVCEAGAGMAAATYHESFVAQILNCLGAISSGEKLVVPGEEGIRSLRLIERCYRSRRLLSPPWFSGAELRRGEELAFA